MLETLITSKTRIKLLLKFFLNENTSSYLRNLESEFGESSNAIRLELNKFEEAGLLVTNLEGNKKIFKANTRHPMFKDIKNILMKYTGLDRIIENIIHNLGDLEEVYLVGELANGLESKIIDLVFVGKVNQNYLSELIAKAEKLISKKVRYIIFDNEEFVSHKYQIVSRDHVILWSKN